MQFRKKPVVIEAWQFFVKDWPNRPRWCDDERVILSHEHNTAMVAVSASNEFVRANEGDWIIEGLKGELYPCKPDIFEATYEPA